MVSRYQKAGQATVYNQVNVCRLSDTSSAARLVCTNIYQTDPTNQANHVLSELSPCLARVSEHIRVDTPRGGMANATNLGVEKFPDDSLRVPLGPPQRAQHIANAYCVLVNVAVATCSIGAKSIVHELSESQTCAAKF